MASRTNAYIKSGNKIQLVSWNGVEFSKNTSSGEEVSVKYSYIPDAFTSVGTDTINNDILQLVSTMLSARLYEDFLADVVLTDQFGNDYRLRQITFLCDERTRAKARVGGKHRGP